MWKVKARKKPQIKSIPSLFIANHSIWRAQKFQTSFAPPPIKILSLDIKTGNKTFEITVMISRLVLRLKKQGGIPVIKTLARVTSLWQFKKTTYGGSGDFWSKGVSLILACNDTFFLIFFLRFTTFFVCFWTHPIVSQPTVDNVGVSRRRVCGCGCWR